MTEGFRVVLDTNVLIYAHDSAAGEKHTAAKEVVDRCLSLRGTSLPAQVLAELSNVALNKLERIEGPDEVAELIVMYAKAFPILPLTRDVVLEAIRGVRDHSLSYYDAQIWAAARFAQADYLLSEDFDAGSSIDGITFIDPFTEAGRELLGLG